MNGQPSLLSEWTMLIRRHEAVAQHLKKLRRQRQAALRKGALSQRSETLYPQETLVVPSLLLDSVYDFGLEGGCCGNWEAVLHFFGSLGTSLLVLYAQQAELHAVALPAQGVNIFSPLPNVNPPGEGLVLDDQEPWHAWRACERPEEDLVIYELCDPRTSRMRKIRHKLLARVASRRPVGKAERLRMHDAWVDHVVQYIELRQERATLYAKFSQNIVTSSCTSGVEKSSCRSRLSSSNSWHSEGCKPFLLDPKTAPWWDDVFSEYVALGRRMLYWLDRLPVTPPVTISAGRIAIFKTDDDGDFVAEPVLLDELGNGLRTFSVVIPEAAVSGVHHLGRY